MAGLDPTVPIIHERTGWVDRDYGGVVLDRAVFRVFPYDFVSTVTLIGGATYIK
jgi:hypothetical protein